MNMNKFKENDIVYVIRKTHTDYKKYVELGIVSCVSENNVRVEFLSLRERRTINGVNINDWSDDKWHKLPKGWDKTSDLYEADTEPWEDGVEEELKSVSIKDKDKIKDLYNRGIMTELYKTFTGSIQVEIDSHHGYRIYQSWIYDNKLKGATYHYTNVYNTFDEAYEVIEEYEAELIRQSELTDEEWSLEQIDNEINYWKSITNASPQEVMIVRNYILSQGDVVELECKHFRDGLKWKKEKQKRWNPIPDDIFLSLRLKGAKA